MEISDRKLFEILCFDKVFFKVYLKDYFKRFLNADNNNDLIIDAFIKFHNNKIIDIKDIIDLGDHINFSYKVFGLRNFNSSDDENAKITSENHPFIYRKLQTLLNCYHGFWFEIDVLERESYFHIQLMRIVPFAHNNELICQLILLSNLMKDNIPPFVLDENDKTIYKGSIRLSDALKFKNIIENKIKEELAHMIKLYKEFYQLPNDKDIKEIILLKV